MAQGKNAFIRYNVLDRCFRDRRKRYYMSDLVDACKEELYNYVKTSELYSNVKPKLFILSQLYFLIENDF